MRLAEIVHSIQQKDEFGKGEAANEEGPVPHIETKELDTRRPSGGALNALAAAQRTGEAPHT